MVEVDLYESVGYLFASYQGYVFDKIQLFILVEDYLSGHSVYIVINVILSVIWHRYQRVCNEQRRLQHSSQV